MEAQRELCQPEGKDYREEKRGFLVKRESIFDRYFYNHYLARKGRPIYHDSFQLIFPRFA